LGFIAGFGETFADSVFLAVGFGVGFGVGLCLATGVALAFTAVAVAVGFGVTAGNSISLFGALTTAFSSAASSCSDRLDSISIGRFGGSVSCCSDSPRGERTSALPNHTMLSAFDEALAATLQWISPAISATCASAIRTTFRQKGFATLNQ
jgi:hypothetical protein